MKKPKKERLKCCEFMTSLSFLDQRIAPNFAPYLTYGDISVEHSLQRTPGGPDAPLNSWLLSDHPRKNTQAGAGGVVPFRLNPNSTGPY